METEPNGIDLQAYAGMESNCIMDRGSQVIKYPQSNCSY